ncbi:MAG: hypothetical protein WC352_08850, partial [Candidatus Omnitrophota bacterium]
IRVSGVGVKNPGAFEPEKGILERLLPEKIRAAEDPPAYLLDRAREYLKVPHSAEGYRIFRSRMRDAFVAYPPAPRILSVVGLSASGKTTVVEKLLRDHPDKFRRMVRTTTRQRRPEDEDMSNHRFMTVGEFQADLADGFLYAPRFNAGDHYGYSLEDILDVLLEDKIIVMEALNSAKELQRLWPYAQVRISGIMPVKYEGETDEAYARKATDVLRARMRHRDASIPDEKINKRLRESGNITQIRKEAGFILLNLDGIPPETFYDRFEAFALRGYDWNGAGKLAGAVDELIGHLREKRAALGQPLTADEERNIRETALWALEAHKHQTRKDGVTPQFTHTLEVVRILIDEFNVTDPLALQIAFLHDAREDQAASYQRIKQVLETDVDGSLRNLSDINRIRLGVRMLTRLLGDQGGEPEYYRRLADPRSVYNKDTRADTAGNPRYSPYSDAFICQIQQIKLASQIASLRDLKNLFAIGLNAPNFANYPAQVFYRRMQQWFLPLFLENPKNALMPEDKSIFYEAFRAVLEDAMADQDPMAEPLRRAALDFYALLIAWASGVGPATPPRPEMRASFEDENPIEALAKIHLRGLEHSMQQVLDLIDEEQPGIPPFYPVARAGCILFNAEGEPVGGAVNHFSQQHSERLAILEAFDNLLDERVRNGQATANPLAIRDSIRFLRLLLKERKDFSDIPKRERLRLAWIDRALGSPMEKLVLVTAWEPCTRCAKFLYEAGVRHVVYGRRHTTPETVKNGTEVLGELGMDPKNIVGGVLEKKAWQTHTWLYFLQTYFPTFYYHGFRRIVRHLYAGYVKHRYGPELEALRQKIPSLDQVERDLADAAIQTGPLRDYVLGFLSDSRRRGYYEQNPEELLEALRDPSRLTLPLRPVRQREAQSAASWGAIRQWNEETGIPYSKYHRNFLNQMNPTAVTRFFTAKLLGGPYETALRNFLTSTLSRADALRAGERAFLDGLAADKPLPEQGVSLVSVRDFSSARALDEGAVVYRLEFARNGASAVVFLKGEGLFWRRWMSLQSGHERRVELNESYTYGLLALLGLPVAVARYYKASAETANLLGFTLMQEIPGTDSQELFERDGKHIRLKPDFKGVQVRLVQELARFGAVFDLLHKGDRTLFALHSQYFCNYRVDIRGLRASGDSADSMTAMKPLDHGKIFNPSNHSVEENLRHKGTAELSIAAAHESFEDPARRQALLEEYRRVYLEMWKRIRESRGEVLNLTEETFGKDSFEYELFAR